MKHSFCDPVSGSKHKYIGMLKDIFFNSDLSVALGSIQMMVVMAFAIKFVESVLHIL
jgi:hypothetical protein